MNISQIGQHLATVAAGPYVAFGPFTHYYSWEPKSMEAACWSTGFNRYFSALFHFHQQFNDSVDPRSLSPSLVNQCLRTAGPFPFAAGPFVALSSPLASRVVAAVGEDERYVMGERPRVPLLNPETGRLVWPTMAY